MLGYAIIGARQQGNAVFWQIAAAAPGALSTFLLSDVVHSEMLQHGSLIWPRTGCIRKLAVRGIVRLAAAEGITWLLMGCMEIAAIAASGNGPLTAELAPRIAERSLAGMLSSAVYCLFGSLFEYAAAAQAEAGIAALAAYMLSCIAAAAGTDCPALALVPAWWSFVPSLSLGQLPAWIAAPAACGGICLLAMLVLAAGISIALADRLELS